MDKVFAYPVMGWDEFAEQGGLMLHEIAYEVSAWSKANHRQYVQHMDENPSIFRSGDPFHLPANFPPKPNPEHGGIFPMLQPVPEELADELGFIPGEEVVVGGKILADNDEIFVFCTYQLMSLYMLIRGDFV